MRWLVALTITTLIFVGTGLLRDWGRWYSWDFFHAKQTEALLRGQLALSHDPGDLIHNACWSQNGVHQVSGLGIPIWQLPFYAIAKVCGQTEFPDRFILGLFVALSVALTLETVVIATLGFRRNDQLFAGWVIGCGAIAILLAFPPFLNLLQSLGGVYEEVLAYVYLFALLLVCGLSSLLKYPTWRRFWTVCALAGLGGLIRPTLVFYGTATVLIAAVVMCRANLLRLGEREQPRRESVLYLWQLWVGLAIFIVGGIALWWTNLLRFGDGLEFGHKLNLQGGRLLGSVYATRFDHPFAHEPFWPAARELFGALFRVEKFNGNDFYAQGVFLGQSSTLRWRNFYFSTYNLSYIGLAALGWGIELAGYLRAWKQKHNLAGLDRSPVATVKTGGFNTISDLQEEFETKDKAGLTTLLTIWSCFAFVLLTIFYLRTPVISSRYMMDFAPAIAVPLVVVWLQVTRAAYAWKTKTRWPLFVLFCVLLGWLGWEIRQGETLEPVRTLTWEEVVQKQARQWDKVVKDLPSQYSLGDDLSSFGIPFNGEGWDAKNGRLMPCIILFVDRPELLELDLGSMRGTDTSQEDAEHIQAKVGLEFLKRESVKRTADGWRLRFGGPTRPRYRSGLQPLFVATVPKENLADDHTPWILKRVSWRSARVGNVIP
jgi:hypothetical protein